MSDTIKVGMADMNVCVAPDGIATLGLGSCVSVVLYDRERKLGGLVHVMLPDSTGVRNAANPAKFADTGIRELVRRLRELGAREQRLEAKMAGGARMFSFENQSDLMKIGEKNVEACRAALRELGIPVVAEDVGKDYGRSVTFYPETAAFEISSVGKPLKII